MEANPYAPPQANLYAPSQNSEAEVIRKAHLNAEANLQSVGGLYILGAIIVLAIQAAQLPTAITMGGKELGVCVVILVLGLIQLSVGVSLRKLKPGSRRAATGLSALGLLAFPIGTLISLYIIYCLNNKRGKFILSPEYEAIREQTPHIKRKTSPVYLILLVLVVLLMVGFFIWLKFLKLDA